MFFIVRHALSSNPLWSEGPTTEKVQSFIEQNGSSRTDKHHEIYLSDPRRTALEKWKTHRPTADVMTQRGPAKPTTDFIARYGRIPSTPIKQVAAAS